MVSVLVGRLHLTERLLNLISRRRLFANSLLNKIKRCIVICLVNWLSLGHDRLLIRWNAFQVSRNLLVARSNRAALSLLRHAHRGYGARLRRQLALDARRGHLLLAMLLEAHLSVIRRLAVAHNTLHKVALAAIPVADDGRL